MTCKDLLRELGKSLRALLHRHSLSHNHDIIKVVTLFLVIFGDFIKHMIILSDPTRQQVGHASIIILGVIGVILLVLNVSDILRDLCTNSRPVHQNKQMWLITSSKALIALGAISYFIGDNLPTYLREFSSELSCDERCEERGLISGVFLLFLSLSTFTFIPSLFKKINLAINDRYDEHYIKKDEYKDFRVQWFIIRMLSLTLDLDAIYTGVWVYAFVDIENCDIDDIYGSSACIVVGWITWSFYGLAYGYYLTNLRNIIKNVWHCKFLGEGYRVLNGFFYGTLALFLTTFLPIHILANNEEPLSCGCDNSRNETLTVFTCEERPGVLETRVAFLFYQMIILTTLGALGTVKYSLKETKYN